RATPLSPTLSPLRGARRFGSSRALSDIAFAAVAPISSRFDGGSMPDDPPSSAPKPTRRTFLLTTGTSAAAAVVAACAPAHPNSTPAQGARPAEAAEGPSIEGAVPITLRVNGKDHA